MTVSTVRTFTAATLLGTLALACGVQGRAQALGADSWRVQCVDQVERCVREAQRVCGDEGYQVLAGRRETKLYGGETGYQTGADLHTLEFRCGSGEPEPAPASQAEPKEAAIPVPPPHQPTKPGSEQGCTPGTTQRCFGPGACEGGQSCNAEGSGFLPCDCGSNSSIVPGPSEPSRGGEAEESDAAGADATPDSVE